MQPILLRAALPAAVSIFALSACEGPADPKAAEPTEQVATVEAAQVTPTNYLCDNSKEVKVAYDGNDSAEPKAVVTIDGKDYQLTRSVSASGELYTTEAGPTPDKLLRWWSKGDEAMWSESPLDDSAKPEDEKLIAKCKVKA